MAGAAVAATFVAELRDKVALLERFPFLGRVGVRDGTREFVVHRNYLVSCRVRADAVEVLQLWHAAQLRHKQAAPGSTRKPRRRSAS